MCEVFSRTVSCFSAADILLPENDLQRWAVIACDQFTSQPEYWEQVKRETENTASAMHLILPECDLTGNIGAAVQRIHNDMLNYLQQGILREYKDSFIYTERTLQNGELRRGLIGKIDLERYDYSGRIDAEVRATEATVTERIPPRMAVRQNAALELPHVLLLCNDDQMSVIEPLGEKKDSLLKLYDFDLMMGGGHVAGWLIQGRAKTALECQLAEYEDREQRKHPDARLLYAVGDGNHSLATAKACYEELKSQNPEMDLHDHPARYALCELNNIHDPSQAFEPIHRLVKRCDTVKLIHDLKMISTSSGGTAIPWVSGRTSGILQIDNRDGRLALSVLQSFLDRWLTENQGELDYIHGASALKQLEKENGSIGFCLPAIDKSSLFPGILSGGALPRKTFSMGEPEEKRYYLEARRILP